mgnify:FL=1
MPQAKCHDNSRCESIWARMKEEVFYSRKSTDMSDCLDHLLEDKYWDGKCFYEVEKFMKWGDG